MKTLTSLATFQGFNHPIITSRVKKKFYNKKKKKKTFVYFELHDNVIVIMKLNFNLVNTE